MNIKVLMLGPGDGVIGGISALTNELVPVLEKNVDLMYFPTVRNRILKYSGIFSIQNIWLAISQYIRFISSFHKFKPNIIHIHTSQGIAWLKDTFYILFAKNRSCRVVLHIHAADYEELYGGKPRLTRLYTRKILGLVDAIITVSDEWKTRLTSIAPANRLYTFKNCITADRFPEKSYVSDSRERKALFLGSVGSRKGVFDLIEAIGIVKNNNRQLKVWIAGYEDREGDFSKAQLLLEKLQLNDTCEFMGMVVGNAKVELLRNADFFVLPSYNEGLPMAILEAMAAGLAVVSTPVGGIPEVVRDEVNGFLVLPGDVKSLAEKLSILAVDQNLCKLMGQRSREIVKQELDVIPYVNRLIALYKSLDQT